MFHPMRRAPSILIVSALLLVPAALLTGCFGSGGGQAADSSSPPITSLLSGDTTESRAEALAPYVKATNRFNDSLVTFDFAITPSLEKMRNGERQKNIALPHFAELKRNLEEARANPRSAGIHKDIDEEADAVLAVLNDLAPLAEKMNAYYSSKGYMADDYAQAAQMTAQYLPLYEAFEAVYEKMDATVTTRHKEVQRARLAELQKAGRTNAANFMELNVKTRELVDLLDAEQIDRDAAEATIAEISQLSGKLPDTPELSSYKLDLNRFIGTFRGFVAGSEDGNNVMDDFNDVVNSSNHIDLESLDKPKK